MPATAPSNARSSLGLGPAMLVVAVGTFMVALAGINARATYGAQVTSDEPQYLLTALSLGEDANLDIADELADERFRAFHEVPPNPQTIELDDSGQRLSPHDPGLPVVLAAPMRLGGWRMAKVSMALMAAATAALTTWVAARRFATTVKTASTVTFGFFATPPLTGYATQIYPEMPAALLVIAGVAALAGTPNQPMSITSQASSVFVIACLPWFAVKYAPIAAVLAIALLRSQWATTENGRRAKKPALLSVLVLALAGAVYLIMHQRVYGGWTVYAAGDHFVDGEFQVVGRNPNYAGRSRRLVGLLVDRGYGLIAWAPAFVSLVPAMAALARRRRSGWMLVSSILVIGWAVATWVALTMHGWWWPGRQVVVVLPVVVVAVASFVDGRRVLFRFLMGASLVGAINWLWLVVEASTGRRTLIVDFTETASPLYRLWAPLLPDHQTPGLSDFVLTGLWVVVLAALGWVAWRDADDHRHPAPTYAAVST